MRKALIFILSLLVTLSLSACGGEEDTTGGETNTTDQPTVTKTAEQKEIIYKKDEVDNELLLKYNEKAEYQIFSDEVSQGNVRSKACIKLSGQYIEIMNTGNNKYVDITILDEGEPEESLFPIFRDFVIAIDDTVTLEAITKAWDDIQATRYEVDISNPSSDKNYHFNNILMSYSYSDVYGKETTVEIAYQTK